ncbi:MAG TPA: fibrobacter succinogenes major paralogous domain-containing protein [Chitinophagaceae bacterium]|nr:fibrobacter succinogenes major paralogous domain-containing protein [Chitinophagaceae bacterium]
MKRILSLVMLTLAISACKKTALPDFDDNKIITAAPGGGGGGGNTLVVTTKSVFVSSAIMARADGEISQSGGGNKVTERGFCYHTSSGPTIANSRVTAGSSYGVFQATLTGLTAATTYYVRAYAIKSGAVYYGNELSLTTLTINDPTPGIGVVYDIDGNPYNTLTYGGKVWMLENLKTTRFRDGTPIPNIQDNNAWKTATTPAWCNYNNDVALGNEYGRLYNLLTVHDSRGLAPAGWRIPTLAEWTDMLRFLGGDAVAGGRIKEAGLTHWNTPNTGDHNGGFNAFGGGYRDYYFGNFSELKVSGQFWSSSSGTGGFGTNAQMYNIKLLYNSASNLIHMGNYLNGHAWGYSVRCIKE